MDDYKILEAARQGDLETVKQLEVSISERLHCYYALFEAAKSGHLEVLTDSHQYF